MVVSFNVWLVAGMVLLSAGVLVYVVVIGKNVEDRNSEAVQAKSGHGRRSGIENSGDGCHNLLVS